MQKLTQRQEMVLRYIESSITERGYPPTLREIGNYMGIRSTNGVNDHLRALERKGYLTREDMKSRALRPTKLPANNNDSPGRDGANGAASRVDDGSFVEVPILGRVAAGALTEAIQNPDDTVRVDRVLLGGAQEVFGLRINGESMINAGINNGDFVFVKKALEARKGEIVIAMVGEEATCKYFYPEADKIRLVPANDQMSDIIIDKSDWRSTQILGVVVGLYRKFN
ncbi:MAG: transcriptional repressor LexA [Myxococcales bacterium]|jgi:repressor LexA